MSFALNDGGHKIISASQVVHNDTGCLAFCGPYVISAVAGWSISKIEAGINRLCELPDKTGAVRPVESYMHLARKKRPTLWSWMQKPRNGRHLSGAEQ